MREAGIATDINFITTGDTTMFITVTTTTIAVATVLSANIIAQAANTGSNATILANLIANQER